MVLVAAILGACVPEVSAPATCNEPSIMLHATVTEERLEPGILEACRGQHVTLIVGVERDGVFHIHGYDDQVQAAAVFAGEELELPFTAVRSGQFPIGYHTNEGSAEATIGTLIVHEP